MSTRRSRSSRQPSGVSRISDDQITDLVSKLQQLIPEIRNSRRRCDKESISECLPHVSPLSNVNMIRAGPMERMLQQAKSSDKDRWILTLNKLAWNSFFLTL